MTSFYYYSITDLDDKTEYSSASIPTVDGEKIHEFGKRVLEENGMAERVAVVYPFDSDSKACAPSKEVVSFFPNVGIEDRPFVVHLKVQQQKVENGPLSFEEFPPTNLDAGSVLLERDDAAQTLCTAMLLTSGNRITPVLDHCFGAGKTSLVWQCRSLAAGLLQQTIEGQALLNATYLSIRFQTADFHPMGRSVSDDKELLVVVDAMVCTQITNVLSISARAALPKVSTPDELIKMLAAKAGGTKFLFHFDDVGAFEGGDYGAKILYRIWNVGESLRRAGYYFVLSGRSRFLHVMGTQRSFPGKPTGQSYQSPNATLLIRADTLSKSAVRDVLVNKNADEWLSKGSNRLDDIWLLTGGIPRVVVIAANYFAIHPDANPDDEGAMNALSIQCPDMFDVCDEALFRVLVELAWAQVEFDPSTKGICGELLTSVLARLGLYTARSTRNPELQVVQVPLYQLQRQHWAPASLKPISLYNEPGERLEAGFRRIISLRLSILEATSWVSVGLGYLDSAEVPFPAVETTELFPFPKISKGASGSADEVSDFMSAVHEHKFEVSRQTFNPMWLTSIYELMKIGQIYQPLLRSSSADTMMRLSNRVLLGWQFKNSAAADIALIREEAEKMAYFGDGWTVYLIIICTNGHTVEDGVDCSFVHKGVQVVAMSRDSVSSFLGSNLLSSVQSNGLLVDSGNRGPQSTSPLKLRYRNLQG